MSQVLCVGPDHLDEVWPHVRRFIEDAYRKTDEIMPDVLAWLHAQKGLLWAVWDGSGFIAAAITSLEPHLSGLICRVSACGGEEMGVWLHHLGEIEDYAKREGCVKVWVTGRGGWSRALDGYRVSSVSLEKRL